MWLAVFRDSKFIFYYIKTHKLYEILTLFLLKIRVQETARRLLRQMTTLLISLMENHKSGQALHLVILTDGEDEATRRMNMLLSKLSSLLARDYVVEWDFLDADALAVEYSEEIAHLK
jgi:archaellum biogenesis ATPase FlaH